MRSTFSRAFMLLVGAGSLALTPFFIPGPLIVLLLIAGIISTVASAMLGTNMTMTWVICVVGEWLTLTLVSFVIMLRQKRYLRII